MPFRTGVPLRIRYARLSRTLATALSMSVVWIVVGVAIAGALANGIMRARRSSESDLGFVSHQWIAEHRLS